jgi:hypothetical protein
MKNILHASGRKKNYSYWKIKHTQHLKEFLNAYILFIVMYKETGPQLVTPNTGRHMNTNLAARLHSHGGILLQI